MSKEELLKTESLTKKYEKVIALNSCSFSLKSGVSLIYGPNGSGKSTLISLMEGLSKPSSGSISLFGMDPVEEHQEVMNNITFLPERPQTLGPRIVKDYFYWYSEIASVPKENIDRNIEYFSIDYVMRSPFSLLSMGEMQIVSLVAALSADRKVYVLDEPNANLDFKRRSLLVREINRLKTLGKSIIISSHVVEDYFPLSERILFLREGKFLGIKTQQEILDEKSLIVQIWSKKPKEICLALKNYNPVLKDDLLEIQGYSAGEILNSLDSKLRLDIFSISTFPQAGDQ